MGWRRRGLACHFRSCCYTVANRRHCSRRCSRQCSNRHAFTLLSKLLVANVHAATLRPIRVINVIGDVITCNACVCVCHCVLGQDASEALCMSQTTCTLCVSASADCAWCFDEVCCVGHLYFRFRLIQGSGQYEYVSF